MLSMKPELSVAFGGVHVTLVDVVPLSAVVAIFDGQFEKTGALTSVCKNRINFQGKR